jgi:hypothetical protein
VHKHDEYRIYFARRHKSNRTDALREQLLRAQKRFCERWKRESTSKVSVVSRNFYQEAGLQAVDYFLWALQRFYERREERYIEYLWPKVSLVRDVDDTRRAKYGEYYTREKPLTIAALEQNPEI